MGAGKGGKYQLSRIGMTIRHTHLGATLINLLNFPDIFQIQLRVNTMGEKVISQG